MKTFRTLYCNSVSYPHRNNILYFIFLVRKKEECVLKPLPHQTLITKFLGAYPRKLTIIVIIDSGLDTSIEFLVSSSLTRKVLFGWSICFKIKLGWTSGIEHCSQSHLLNMNLWLESRNLH